MNTYAERFFIWALICEKLVLGLHLGDSDTKSHSLHEKDDDPYIDEDPLVLAQQLLRQLHGPLADEVADRRTRIDATSALSLKETTAKAEESTDKATGEVAYTSASLAADAADQLPSVAYAGVPSAPGGSFATVPASQKFAPWYAWDIGFPQFAAGTSRASRISVWTCLGNLWWMQFIDGQFHRIGPLALEGTKENLKFGMDGQILMHYREEYDRWSTADAWDQHWTADLMGQLNARFRNTECKVKSCLDHYSVDPAVIERLWPTLSDDERAPAWHRRLDGVLADYYLKVRVLERLSQGARLQQGIAHITHLFNELALLHPFNDANSRTRLFVIQTEMVRLGGHPLMMWDIRDEIYSLPGSVSRAEQKLQNWILDGWCAWEFVAAKADTPYSSEERIHLFDESTASCYDSV